VIVVVGLTFRSVLGTGMIELDQGLVGLDLVEENGVTRLLSATGSQGGAASWTLDGAGAVTLTDTTHFSGSFIAAEGDLLGRVRIDGADLLVVGRQTDGTLLGQVVAADGRLTGFRALRDMGQPGAAAGGLARVDMGGGDELVFYSSSSGIGAMWSDPARTFAGSLPGTLAFPGAPQVMASVGAGSAQFLIAGFAEAGGVACYRISGANGGLSLADRTGADYGLGLERPVAIETLVLDGKSYAVVAGQGTSSLSVFEIGAEGALRVADHVIDSLHSRFADVSALATATVAGRAYVVAGGSDDGLSLFELLPGGRLLHLDSLADTETMGLANVRDLAMRGADAGAAGRLDIFAASWIESGVTQLSVDLAAGQVLTAAPGGATLTGGGGADLLTGGAGWDQLYGGAGDDVLMDGGGTDRLEGGAGADIFVMAADGLTDRIYGFQAGLDTLDLSGWWLFYGPAQLSVTATAWGAVIGFGAEVVELHAGSALSAAEVAAAVRSGPDRPPLVLSEAPLPAPEPVPESASGTSGKDRLTGTDGADTLSGLAGDDVILGMAGDDMLHGDEGDDTIRGHAGHDTILAGEGNDRIWSGSGNDRVWGGPGDDFARLGAGSDHYWAGVGDGGIGDTVYGEGGADRIDGGSDADRLHGGGGYDWIEGGAGADRIWGDGGNDTLIGGEGDDMIWGGSSDDLLQGDDGDDRLWGDAGDDTLLGDAGNDTLYGGDGDDILTGGDGDDVITGGAGSDHAYLGFGDDSFLDGPDPGGEAGADWVYGGPGADSFVFSAGINIGLGGSGDDRITGGGTDREWFWGEDGNDWLTGSAGDDGLYGGYGDDVLEGGDGRDSIEGGPGRDLIFSGPGNDLMSGGGAGDRFVIREGDGYDRISDFERGVDRLWLQGLASGIGEVSTQLLPEGLWISFKGGGLLLEGLTGIGAGDFIFS
jgi:Ca2+-binding RTX toxin-like protein